MIINRCLKVRSFILATAFLAGLGFGTRALAEERLYLVDLNRKTATEIEAFLFNDLNDAGQVVGLFLTAEGRPHAFITGPGGVGMRDLGTLGGDYSQALGINNLGQVVGFSSTAESGTYSHGFITGPDGVGMRDLGREIFPEDINGTGQVVGWFNAESGSHAFITGPDGGGMRDLGTLGGFSSYGKGINEAGQVAGYYYTAAGETRAFITGPDGVGMRDLGNLGGDDSYANGINDAGQVAGYSDLATGGTHAFITGPDGVGMRDIGTLGGTSSYARGINDAGQVVGESGYHAFITGPNGAGMADLNSLVDLPPGVVLENAIDINNAGQVIAHTPFFVPEIPEPETYALMLAGLGVIGFMVRRRRKG